MDGLYKLWIIHRQIGVVIFEQTFEELPVQMNSDLIGGFLMAILSFGEEIAAEEIDYIQLKNLRIVYHLNPKYIIAVVCGPNTNYGRVEHALVETETQFEAKYKRILEGFSGDVAVFSDFATETEAIFESKSQTMRYINHIQESLKERYGSKLTHFQELSSQIMNLDGYLEQFDLVKNVKNKINETKQFFGNLKKSIENLTPHRDEGLHDQLEAKKKSAPTINYEDNEKLGEDAIDSNDKQSE